MASLHKGRSGVFNVSFRYNGRQFLKSTKTHSRREAMAVQAKVDETLRSLRTGRIAAECPPNVDLGDWILSACTLAIAESVTLEAASTAYTAAQADKAERTKKGESKHLRHLCRVIGPSMRLDRITLKTLERYVQNRRAEPAKTKGRTHRIASDATIRKELVTFSQLWAWALRQNHVTGLCPIKDPNDPRKWAIRLEKQTEKEPFMTWAEIEGRIARESIPEKEQGELWGRLYLDETQKNDLLDHVQSGPYPFMVAAFMLAAEAGLRRSEIIRAQISDVKLDQNLLLVREQKRVKSKQGTFRSVPMSARLKTCLASLLTTRTSGSHLIVDENGEPLTEDNATHYFQRTLAKSKWSVVKGYHTLRHSFAST